MSDKQVIYDLILEVKKLTELVGTHYAWSDDLGVHNISPQLEKVNDILLNLTNLGDSL